MQRLPAYFFPNTVPEPATALPLVQVFQPVVYWQPVENDAEQDKWLAPPVSQLVEEGRLRLEAPAPLGPLRQRFLHLLTDIRGQGSAYREQFASLSLAGLATGRGSLESKGSIVSSLLGMGGIENSPAHEVEQLLWQARLLLKLGEMHDREQAELDAQLQEISSRESALLSELLNEDDEGLFPTTAMLSSAPKAGLAGHRLTAWTRLLDLGAIVPSPSAVFVTDLPDAVDLLLEAHEYRLGTRMETTAVLDLPQPAWSAGAEEVRPTPPLPFAAVQEALTLPGDEAASAAARWNAAVKAASPSRSARLELYRCPGLSPRNLFVEAFDHGRRTRRQADQGETVLGLLRLD